MTLCIKGGPAVYPDFGSPDCINWWSKATKKISSLLEYDGLWLVNNEPLSEIDGSVNGCLDDNFNNPPYVPEALNDALYDQTLCMDALLTWKYDIMPHYDAHNLYGHSMAAATEQALASNFPSERKLILSDSTFTGTGHHAGHYLHIPQNSWEVFRSSISDVLRFQMHGVTMTGIGACENPSQNQENDEELCVRWLQCAIFYPLLQLHYEGTEYLHKSLSNKEVIHSIRNALSRRYELLPQLYTLLYLAHIKGSTVVRPLFSQFSN
ncbi:sucrase-isomaltase, intestinal [Caerostris extrusa]|uniref:Sucrase-isomaltase, intestinal n=1 Tax=Caerostris extrusa TaxID=172846 RepID=A0AAV4N4B6_CAEEX|nr:sucrase-isomaltase, intestinal [Caerostris extrusa]